MASDYEIKLWQEIRDELFKIRVLMEGHTERLARMDEEQKQHRIDWLDVSAKHDDAVRGLAGVVGRVAESLDKIK